MQLELTEDQRMLVASAEDWLAAHAGISVGGPHVRMQAEALWAAYAELGLLALPFADDVGGMGGGPLDLGLLMHELGRHLMVVPYASSIVVAGSLLDRLGSTAQRKQWLPGVVAGSVRPALAHSERAAAWPWMLRSTKAWREGEAWRFSGDKLHVEDAPSATHWVVTASCDDGHERVFLVPAQPSAVRADYPTLPGGRAVDLRLDAIVAPADAVLAEPGSHAAAIHAALSAGLLAQCWAAAGVIDALVTRTAAHVTERRQFGRALIAFQAIQHRLAEMEVRRLEARAACELASMRMAHGDDLASLASDAKVRVAAAADVVSKQAIQLHGGMGVCEELPVARAFRWLAAFQAGFGQASVHARVAGRRRLEDGRMRFSAVLEGQV